MDEIGVVKKWVLELGGHSFTFNWEFILFTWAIMFFIIVYALLATRNAKLIPGGLQSSAELLVATWDDLVKDSLGLEDRKYFPMICTVFILFWICNMIGVLPFFKEPTQDLNTTLSLGIIGFVVAHYSGIKAKGIGPYLKAYAEPIFFMAPLNIIGELSKVVSISFRLFGNIMGGSIIILVVSHLVFSLVLPPFLYAFFGIFVGTIQAFVFTMLTLVYISVQIR